MKNLSNCFILFIFFLFLFSGCSTVESQETKTGVFEARNAFHVNIPTGAKKINAWFAIPNEGDTDQKISEMKIESPFPTEFKTDEMGNRFLYIEVSNPQIKEFDVVTTFKVERKEVSKEIDPAKTRPITDEERAKMAQYLKETTHVVITDEIRKKAQEAVGAEKNPITANRKIYDSILNHVDYWVKDPENKKSSGVGSSVYTYEKCTGNCTDFHSLYLAMARSQGFPTRIIYGSFFKGELNGKDADQSYHCWIEFYAPNIGWIPLDVAIADIFVGDFELNEVNHKKVQLTVANGYKAKDQKMVDYYFGNLEERRVTWHMGRDLKLNPSQKGGPVNALPKAYLEIDGTPAGKGVWTRKLTYKEL